MKRLTCILLALLLAGAAWGQFTFIASAKADYWSTATTVTCGTSLNVAAGDLLIAVAGHATAGQTVDTIAETGGGNGMTLTAAGTSTTYVLRIGYKLVATSNATATFRATFSGASNHPGIIVLQFRPSAGYAAVLDTGPSTADGWDTAIQTANFTTTGTDEVVVGGSYSHGNTRTNSQIADGAATAVSTASEFDVEAWYRIFTATQSNIHAQQTASYGEWLAQAVSFKSELVGYAVSYSANGGTGSQTDASSPYAENDTVTVLGKGTMASAGRTWLKWNTAANGTGTDRAENDTFAMPAANVTLYAQWSTPRTFYIDYGAANDSGVGAKADPWKRHPYMTGFSGTYTHAAGDVFVFKGGVTWPATCFTMAIVAGGSAGNIDTYTVDATWYTGGSWTRPVWDGEYATLTTSQTMVGLDTLAYITFNNLEVKRHKSLVNQGTGIFALVNCNYIQWTYCYLHSWSLDAGVATDDAHGAIYHLVNGINSMTGVVVDHCEIENSALTGVRQNGVGIRQINTIRFSTLHNMSSLSLFAGDIHDNTVYNIGSPAGNASFDGAYHTNIFYMDAWNGAASPAAIPAYFYNNIIYDVSAGSSPIYPATGYDATFYIYNNLVYGVNSSNMAVQIDPGGGTGDVITAEIYNNTFLMPNGIGNAIHCVDRAGNPRVKSVTAKNNHIIGTNVGTLGGIYATSVLSNNLIQTAAVAAAEGYVVGNLYAPTSGSDSTVDTGTTVALFSTDIGGVSRPQGAAWDIGAYEYVAATTRSANTAARFIVLLGCVLLVAGAIFAGRAVHTRRVAREVARIIAATNDREQRQGEADVATLLAYDPGGRPEDKRG